LATANSPGCELRLNIILMMSEDSEFLKGLVRSPSALQIVGLLLHFLRHRAMDETLHHAFVTALSVLINFGDKLSSFDTKSSEFVWALAKWFPKLSANGKRYAEYVRLLMLLTESLVVHHPQRNLPMIYSALRHCQLLTSFQPLFENSENPQEFAASVQNLKVVTDLLTERVVAVIDAPHDADELMKAIVPIVRDWDAASLFQVREFPRFTYLVNEFMRSVKFFRVMILKDIQEMM
jgi:hypothetical protein